MEPRPTARTPRPAAKRPAPNVQQQTLYSAAGSLQQFRAASSVFEHFSPSSSPGGGGYCPPGPPNKRLWRTPE
eukprot:1717025-Alexandrium_andersonii.AAC.1